MERASRIYVSRRNRNSQSEPKVFGIQVQYYSDPTDSSGCVGMLGGSVTQTSVKCSVCQRIVTAPTYTELDATHACGMYARTPGSKHAADNNNID